MLNQELLLLGILKEGSKHGYEIKKKLNEIIDNLALSKISSIYYPLSILEKNGLVVKKKGQEGKRPKKFTYTLTQKGEDKFLDLLEQSLLVIKKPHFDINVSLYFLPYVDPRIAVRRLRARQAFLNRIKNGVLQIEENQGKKNKPHIAAILEHNLALVQAEIDFISKLTQAIKNRAKGV